MEEEVVSYQSACRIVREQLAAAGIGEAKNDAWLLLEHVTGMDRTRYLLCASDPMSREQWDRYKALADRRAERIPLQHLTGVAWFMGVPYFVNDQVLIPREDTQVLVEAGLEYLRDKAGSGQKTIDDEAGPEQEYPREKIGSRQKTSCDAAGSRQEYLRDKAGSEQQMKVLDLCTGSGCVLLSVMMAFPGVSGIGTDLSEAALAVAMENARRLQVNARFLQGDLFDALEAPAQAATDAVRPERSGRSLTEASDQQETDTPRFDLILSNPPYIPTKELDGLEPEVRDHDPRLALDGGEDGLAVYRQILAKAGDHLTAGGMLALEHGYDQGAVLRKMLKEHGFTGIETRKDLAGLERVTLGVKGHGSY